MNRKIFIALFILILSLSQTGFCQEKVDTFLPDSLQAGKIRGAKTELKLQKKSPTGALLRSLVFPGWGQFYNKQYFKSALVFGGESALLVAAVVDWSRAVEHKRNFEKLSDQTQLGDKLWEFEQYKFYRDRRNQFLWITAAVVFVSMFDAYVDAHIFDFNQEQMEDIHVNLAPKRDGLMLCFSLSF